MLTARHRLTVIVAALVLLPSLASAQAPKAGVVTTLEGTVTATRTAAPPVPLRFKDDVFLQDKITTAEESLARMLLGGKAVVTVRERSVLTITEVPGRSTIEIDSGKFALAVARERMRPGEVIEIRTPNAIAGVRGSVIVTEVESPAGAPIVVSNLYVLRGNVEAQPRDRATQAPIGVPRTINVMEQFRVVGLLATVSAIRPEQLGAIRAGLQPKSKPHDQAQNQDQIATQQMQTATALAATLVGPGGAAGLFAERPAPLLPAPAEPTVTIAPLEPLTDEVLTAFLAGDLQDSLGNGSTGSNTTGAVTGSALNASKVGLVGGALTNPGFETGDLAGWTLSGGGGVISSFGTLTPREGNFMALIHTNNSQSPTTLSQSFDATKSIVTISARGFLLSNEFPTFTSTNSQFN